MTDLLPRCTGGGVQHHSLQFGGEEGEGWVVACEAKAQGGSDQRKKAVRPLIKDASTIVHNLMLSAENVICLFEFRNFFGLPLVRLLGECLRPTLDARSCILSTYLFPSRESERLPLPSFTSELIGASVFANPYHAAEDARRAVLEKHVKLTTSPADLSHINGKQICWNYRKGRCRFGRNCKFAHDSDLQKGAGEEEVNSAEASDEATLAEVSGKRPHVLDGEQPRKKRPGLSQTLVPGKKVVKMFNKIQKGPLV